jgi:riboflavin kinase/FMN adenylyltransferase
MDVFDGYRSVPRLPAPCVAIGNFDGVHRGHRALLDTAIARAKEHGGTALALTFDPHPAQVLAPHLAPPALTSRARKVELMAAAGLAGTIVEPFTPALAALPAERFVEEILIAALGVRHVVVGWDFTYGQGRGGTTASLQAHGARAGFGVDVLEKITVDGEVASSTRIRGYLRGGDLAAARRLLGRDYDLDGTVVKGAQRGRDLGFPTANLATDIAPPLGAGIYAGWLEGGALGGRRPAAISLGTNPTFATDGRLTLEAYVLDWSGDLYDQRLRCTFVARLRDHVKFDGVDALVARIHQDVADTRTALGLPRTA